MRPGFYKITGGGTSLAVQWLGLCAPTAGGMGSIPGWGTKIPHAAWCGKKKKKKKKKNHWRRGRNGGSISKLCQRSIPLSKSTHGSVLQLPIGLCEYLRGSPGSVSLLRLWATFEKGCTLLFDVSPGDQHSAKNTISVNPMLKEQIKEWMKKQSCPRSQTISDRVNIRTQAS